jgi:sodium/potassium-transporting ATPase subunit alpha
MPLKLYDPEDKKRICKSIALTGKDLPEMTDLQWEQLCQYEEIVFARTTPEQKLRIVKEFQKRKNVVGMTVFPLPKLANIRAME